MQLAFDLKLHSDATFENFIASSNGVVVDVLKKISLGHGEHGCYLWAQPGEGVSHLLQAVCHEAQREAISHIYLPLKELKTFGASLLNGAEEVSVICLDDVDLVAGDQEWEEALFHLFNRSREVSGCLVVGAHHAVNDAGFHLQDLVSRLSWGGIYKLSPLTDQAKIDVLQSSAKRRGFELTLEVTKYLLSHYPRDFGTQFLLLDRLDALSLQEKRKITLHFVRQYLADFMF